jgi:DNA-binding CsgD family transcriptional regulator
VARRRDSSGPALPGPCGVVYLTKRQFEVLELAASGLVNREIAAHLGISPRSVEDRFDEMRARTQIPTRLALLAYAGRAGLVLRGKGNEAVNSGTSRADRTIIAADPRQGISARTSATVGAAPASRPGASPESSLRSPTANGTDEALIPASGDDMLAPEPASYTGILLGYTCADLASEGSDCEYAGLAKVGCDRIFADQPSTSDSCRCELQACLSCLRPGDTLVVPSLNQLAQSVNELLLVISLLRDRGIGLKSLHESLDTTAPGGRLVFHVFSTLGEAIRQFS